MGEFGEFGDRQTDRRQTDDRQTTDDKRTGDSIYSSRSLKTILFIYVLVLAQSRHVYVLSWSCLEFPSNFVSCCVSCLMTAVCVDCTCQWRSERGCVPCGTCPGAAFHDFDDEYKNSSGDEIANANFLRRHRTCRGQRLRPLNRLPNFYYN